MRMFAILLALLAFASLSPAATAAGDGVRPDPIATVLDVPTPQGRQLAQSCGYGYDTCLDQCRDSYDGCRVVQSESVCVPRYRSCTSVCRRRHC